MQVLPDTLCHLNGETLPLRDARVSVLDRGFLFGDGVYEVVPFYAGRPFCFAQHMARLDRSLAAVRMANPHTPADWLRIASTLVAAAQATPPALQPDGTPAAAVGDRAVYLQVTRGVAPRDHAIPAGTAPSVFAMVNPLVPVSTSAREQGVVCVTADDFRWQKAHIKSTSLLGAVLARQISADVGAAETVMFRDGWLSEGASSNVWVVRDGTVIGPPNDHRVLEGIRYGIIEALCREAALGFALQPISRADVFAADELLLSSATKEVVAVTVLDSAAVGTGHPGPAYQRLYAGYQRAKQRAAAAPPFSPLEDLLP